MPKVLNKSTSQDGVYIGRPSKYGNPFVIGKDGTREEVIRKFEEWFLNNPKLIEDAKRELAGKNLICWCAPKTCHGNIILNVVNNLHPNDKIKL